MTTNNAFALNEGPLKDDELVQSQKTTFTIALSICFDDVLFFS